MCHERMVVASYCAGNCCCDTGYRVAVPVDVAMDRGCVELNKLASNTLHAHPNWSEIQYAICRFYGLTPKHLDELPWQTVMKMYEAAIR